MKAGASLRLPDVRRGDRIVLFCDGIPVEAYEGETVGAALLASGRLTLRHTSRSGAPRGMFCAMGTCFECAITVDGLTGVRACMQAVRNGMRVETGG